MAIVAICRSPNFRTLQFMNRSGPSSTYIQGEQPDFTFSGHFVAILKCALRAC
jgi:hypothetical protein